MSRETTFKFLHLTSIVFTIVLAIITLCGIFSTRVSPVESSFFPFVGLILPGLLLADFALFVYWTARLRHWAWIPMVAIFANWSYITSMYQLPFTLNESVKEKATLKIATFNTGAFGRDNSGYTQRRVAFYMGEQEVDIICLQEFAELGSYDADSLKSLYSAWPYTLISKFANDQALLPIAVYSRYPIIDSQIITYEGTPNSSLWVDVSCNGKVVRIFANHLQTTNINQSLRQYDKYYKNSGSLDADMQFISSTQSLYYSNEIRRALQADIINQMVKESPHPVIVCGDFNSTPASYVYRAMKGDLKDGFKTAGKGYASTFRYFKGLLRIDYIFHSPSMKGISYYSTKIDLNSDHYSVIMEVEL